MGEPISERRYTMNDMTRRQAMQALTATGAVVLGASTVEKAEAQAKTPKHNTEPPVESKASPASYGPREMFAIIDADGSIKRGMHVVSATRLGLGTYEVIFVRDVRRGAYFATAGGQGYSGVPLPAAISVNGRAIDPRGVLVYVTSLSGDPQDSAFHLLVICPDGYA
jgi:hypothetical protein